ncbi:MAG: spermidine synthase [Myxococcota bacterium]
MGRIASPGGELVLRQRGERDFLITVDGRVLMTSTAHRSECDLAAWVCSDLEPPRPRVLIGGLGMGYTLRAALDVLPPGARVCAAELETGVVDWCRGPLAPLTGNAIGDSRVEIRVGDVMEVVREAAEGRRPAFDAIAIDLFEGPRGDRREETHPLYGSGALGLFQAALTERGWLGVWSEAPAQGFVKRLGRLGYETETRRAGRGGRHHTLFRARPARQAAPGFGRNADHGRARGSHRRRR